MRYDLRLLENGWAVWDTETNAPAVVNGRWQTALLGKDAAALAGRLNAELVKPIEKPAG